MTAGNVVGAVMAILIAAAAAADEPGLADEVWLELPSGVVLLQAFESPKNGAPCKEPDPAGEPCWYDYVAYRWQPTGGFRPLLSMESSAAIDTGNRPLAYDLGFITDRIAEVDRGAGLLAKSPGGNAYDPSQWIAVRDTAMDLGPGLHQARVLVLRSRATTGESAYGEALYDVEVILLDGDRVLHRSLQPHQLNAPDPVYFTSAEVRVRDVTGDHIPELFYSTHMFYVTDYATKEHILHRRRAGSTEFRDIAPEQFEDIQHGPFKWIERDGEVLAVQASQVPPEEGEQWTHGSDKRYVYEIYRWDSARERFARIVRVEGREKRQWDGQQIDDDMPLIDAALQHRAHAKTHQR
jgi:hypothetical protein